MLLPLLSLFAATLAVEPGTAIPLAAVRTDVTAETLRTTPAGDQIISNVHNPRLIPYLPAKPNGPSVILIPGGGHQDLWTTHEGHAIAKWLSDRGITAFVLYYRLARQKDSTYTVEGESLADTQKAIEVVRAKAAEWKIDPANIGVMGFSAGGELAALASMRYTKPENKPSFQVLVYPAIPKQLNLTRDTPPAFLVCGEQDRPGIAQGLAELYVAMRKAEISTELHIYAGVGHGFGLRPTLKGPVRGWLDRFAEWLAAPKGTPGVKDESSVTSKK